MNPFHWIKAAFKARAKSAVREGIAEGTTEALQEFAAALEGLTADLPALEDKPKARKAKEQ